MPQLNGLTANFTPRLSPKQATPYENTILDPVTAKDHGIHG